MEEGASNSGKSYSTSTMTVLESGIVKCAKDFILGETLADLLCLGEVGIGNTTTSSILLAAITGGDPENLVDGGAMLARDVDQALMLRKIGIVKKALSKRKYCSGSVMGVATTLVTFGGAEIATLVGAILQASEQNLPVLLDGFIVTVAALVASYLSPSCCRVFFFSTESAEKGHDVAVKKIQEISRQNGIPFPSNPALSMQLRMGEATGALMAVPLLRCACTILSEMGTLEQVLGGC